MHAIFLISASFTRRGSEDEGQLNVKSNCEICKSLLQKYNGRSHDHISEYQVLNPFILLSYLHSLYMAWKGGY